MEESQEGWDDLIRRCREEKPQLGAGEPFVRGPIPVAWVAAAAALGGQSLAVGLLLWFRSGMQRGGRIIKLRESEVDLFGLGRRAIRNGLARLQGAGLARLEDRRWGHLPAVRLQWRGVDVSQTSLLSSHRATRGGRNV